MGYKVWEESVRLMAYKVYEDSVRLWHIYELCYSHLQTLVLHCIIHVFP